MVLDNPSSGIINIEFINAFNCSKLVGYSVLQEFVGYLKSQEGDGLPPHPFTKNIRSDSVLGYLKNKGIVGIALQNQRAIMIDSKQIKFE
jgi:hypothetical protein